MVGKDAENFDPTEQMNSAKERVFSPAMKERVRKLEEDADLVEKFVGFLEMASGGEELDYDTWIAIGQENGWPVSPVPTPRSEIEEYFEATGENVLLMDGFDEALIGFSQRINEPLLAVYSYYQMVSLLVHRDGMSIEEAEEYIDYNCVGAWMGEKTPIIVSSLPY
jgi:hypothetical protein